MVKQVYDFHRLSTHFDLLSQNVNSIVHGATLNTEDDTLARRQIYPKVYESFIYMYIIFIDLNLHFILRATGMIL